MAPSRRSTKTRPRLGCSEDQAQATELFLFVRPKIALLSKQFRRAFVIIRPSRPRLLARSRRFRSLFASLISKIWSGGNPGVKDRPITSRCPIDNAAPIPTVTALKRAEIISRFYETDLPAIEANAQTPAWISCAYEDKGGRATLARRRQTRSQAFAPERR